MKRLFAGWRDDKKKPEPASAEVEVSPRAIEAAGGNDTDAAKQKAAATVPASASALEQKLQLELGDFLPHLPKVLLKEGELDLKLPVVLDYAEVAKCLAEGCTSGQLAGIAQQVPSVFNREIGPDSDEGRVLVLYPWQKIKKLLQESRDPGDTSGNRLRMLLNIKQKAAAQRQEEAAKAQIPDLPLAEAVSPFLKGRKSLDPKVSWFSGKADVPRAAKPGGEAKPAPQSKQGGEAGTRLIPFPSQSAAGDSEVGPKIPDLSVAEEGSGLANPPAPRKSGLKTMPDLSVADLADSPETPATAAKPPLRPVPDLSVADFAEPPEAPAVPAKPGARPLPDLELAGPDFDLELEKRIAALKEQHDRELTRLKAERDEGVTRLAAECEAAVSERDAVQQKLDAVLTEKHLQHEAELTKLRGSHEAARAELQETHGREQEELAALKAEQAAAIAAAEAKTEELKKQWELTRGALEERIAAFSVERGEAVAKAVAERDVRLAQLTEECRRLADEKQTTIAAHEQRLAELTAQQQESESTLIKRHEASVAEAGAAREKDEQAIAQLRTELAERVAEAEATAKQRLAELDAEHARRMEGVSSDVATAVQAERQALQARHREEVGRLANEHAAELAGLVQARDADLSEKVAVLAERDRVLTEAAAAHEAALTSLRAGHEKRLEELEATRGKDLEEFNRLQAENARLVETARVEAERKPFEIEAAVRIERERVLAELHAEKGAHEKALGEAVQARDAALAEIAAERDALAQQKADLQKEHEGRLAELEKLQAAALAASTDEMKAATAPIIAARAAAEEALEAHRKENVDRLAQANLAAELRIEELRQEWLAATQKLETEAAEARKAQAAVAQERDELVQRLGDLAAGHSQTLESHLQPVQAELARARGEKKSLVEKLAAAEGRLGYLQSDHEMATGELEKLRRERALKEEQLSTQLKAHKEAEKAWRAEHEQKLATATQEQRQALETQLEPMRAELTKAQEERQALMERLQMAEARVSSIHADHQSATGELEKARRELAEKVAQIAAQTLAREEEAKTLRGEHEQKVTALGAEHAQTLEAQLQTVRADLSKALEEKRALGEKLAAAEGRLGSIHTDHETATGDLEKLRRELAEKAEQVATQTQAHEQAKKDLRAEHEQVLAALGGEHAQVLEAQLKPVRADLAKAQEEKLALTQKLKAAEGRLGYLQSDHEMASAELEKLRRAVAGNAEQVAARMHAQEQAKKALREEHEQRVATLRTELAQALEAQLQPVRADLAKAQEEKQALAEKLTAAEARAGSIHADHQTATGELEKLRRELAEKGEQISAQTQAHEQAQKTLREEHEQKITALGAEHAQTLESQLQPLRTDLAKAQEEKQALAEKLTAAEARAGSIHADHQTTTGDLEKLRRELTEKVEQIAAQTQTHEQAQKTLREEHEQKITALNAEHAQTLESQLQPLRADLTRGQEEKQSLAEKLVAAESQLGSIKADYQTATAEVESLRKDLAAKAEQLTAQTRAHEDAQKGLREEYQQKFSALNAEHAQTLESQLQPLRADLTRGQEEKQALAEKLTAAEGQLGVLKTDHQTATTDLEKLRSELADKAAHLASQAQAHEQAQRSLREEHDQKFSKLSAELAQALETQLQPLRSDLARSHDEKHALVEKLASAEGRLGSLHADHQSAMGELEKLRRELAEKATHLTAQTEAHEHAQKALREEHDRQLEKVAQEHAKALIEKLEPAQAEFARTREEKEILAGKLGAAETRVTELEMDHHAANSEVQRLREEVNATNEALAAEVRARAESEAAQRSEHERKISELTTEHAKDLAAKLEPQKAELVRTLQEKQEFVEKFGIAQVRLQKLDEDFRTSATALERARAELTGNLELLAAQRKMQQELETKLRAEHEQKLSEISKAHAQQLDAQVKPLQGRLTKAVKDQRALAEQFSAADSRVTHLEAERRSASAEMERLRSELAKKSEALTAQAGAHEKLTAQHATALDELKGSHVKALADELTPLKLGLAKGAEEQARLSQKLAETEARATRTDDELKKAQTDLERLRAELAEKQRAAESTGAKHEETVARLGQDHERKLSAAADEHTRAVADLRTKHETAMAQNAAAEARVAQLGAERQLAATELERVRTELAHKTENFQAQIKALQEGEAKLRAEHEQQVTELNAAQTRAREELRAEREAASAREAAKRLEEQAAFEQLRREAAERLTAATEAAASEKQKALAALREEHEEKATKWRTEHATALGELKGQSESFVRAKTEAAAQAERQIADIEARYEAELASLREKHDAQEKTLAEKDESLAALAHAHDRAFAAKDEEFASATKEHEFSLHQTLEEHQWEVSAAKTECDSLARELTEAVRQHAQELEALKASHQAMLEAERARMQQAMAEKDNLLEWKARALAELEAEMATYRNKVQAAVQQRDKMAQEKDRVLSELKAQAEAMSSLHRHMEGLSMPTGDFVR